jgi:hypothetical protein
LQLTTDFDLTIPQTVCQWLARLVLLYRVPFTYLVADERMLPPDSMRFFYLDPGWLKCLLEGACSVGRSVAHDELVDEYLRDKFLDFAMEPVAGSSDEAAADHFELGGQSHRSDDPWFRMRSRATRGSWFLACPGQTRRSTVSTR